MTTYLIAFLLCVVVIVVYWYVSKTWGQDSEKHSHYASAFQNIIIVLSIICTGAWTIQTFDVLQQKERAAADLEELQERINNTESTNISISTQIVDYNSEGNDKDEKGLIIDITIKNQGKSKISFDLSDYPLKIYTVAASGSKVGSKGVLTPKLYSSLAEVSTYNNVKTNGKNIPISRWISLASSERTLSYFVTLKSNEMYYIVFSSKAKNIDTVKDECNADKCNWFVSKYIYVSSKQ